MSFLANFTDPKNQAIFCKSIPYGPVNPATFALLDAETKAALPNAPDNAKTAVFQNFGYWADNGSTIIERFNKWLLG